MDKKEYEAIGLRIRTVQRSLGLVDKDVVELLCIEVSSYRDMVHGRRPIGECYFIKLCNNWKVSMDYLFYEIEDGDYFLNEKINQDVTDNLIHVADIAKRIRGLKVLPKAEILDYMIEIQEAMKELMIYIQGC